MLKPFLLLAVVMFATGAVAEEDSSSPYKKATMSYWIYGGSLGDPVAPLANDKKVAISVEGQAAKELFDAIGPDVRDACTEGSGTRVRIRDRGNLTCLRRKEGVYECSFGFDLRNGKSIGGSIC